MTGRGRLGRARESDELVAEVDERHSSASPAELEAINEPSEELEHLVDVADLDGNVVDPDEPRHVLG